jgi:hypothetical protein
MLLHQGEAWAVDEHDPRGGRPRGATGRLLSEEAINALYARPGDLRGASAMPLRPKLRRGDEGPPTPRGYFIFAALVIGWVIVSLLWMFA